jgi:cytochrome P450
VTVDRPLVEFDHYEPAQAADPYPRYEELRRTCPVGWSKAHEGFWVVSRYEDIAEISHRPDVFSSRYVTVPRDIGMGDVQVPPLHYDPPEHSRIKKLLASAFVPARVAALEEATRASVDGLIGRFVERGRCDASQDYAKSVPVGVICRLLDLPSADEERFVGWAYALLEITGSPEAMQMAMEMLMYLNELVEGRRREPGDDLVSYLAHAVVEGDQLEPGEIVLSTVELIVAGIDTTWDTLAAALWHLAQHPDQQRWLRDGPERIPAAIEEFLRVFAPVTVGRLVKADTEFRGQQFGEGEMVLIPFPSANRDEGEFPDPDRVILDREPNRHFAFGTGIHRCVGANLARMELSVALKEFLRRVPEFRLEDEAAVDWCVGHIRGPRHVPIVFA